jgi:hypothetical protein
MNREDLANQRLILSTSEVGDMIPISSQASCGGKDFRCRGWVSGRQAGGL